LASRFDELEQVARETGDERQVLAKLRELLERAGDDARLFAARMMDRLEVLLTDVMARHRIPPAGVIGHACMAPGRKSDPGRRFDWRRLARGGLSVWPEPLGADASAPDATRFAAALATFGYPEAAEGDLLGAFRDRFRPGAAGPLSAADMGIAAALARNCAVDRRDARA